MQMPIIFPEDNLKIEVTTWNFVHQFYSLITCPELVSDITQLDVNPDNPFSKYNPTDKRLNCFHSGKWYYKAWKNLISPDTNEWLCPIIFACDETWVGSHLGQSQIQPLMFTLSVKVTT